MQNQDRSGNSDGHAISILFAGVLASPETFLARLARGLANEGMHVTFAVNDKPRHEWFEHPNLHWVYAPGWNETVWRRLFGILRVGGRALFHTREVKQMYRAGVGDAKKILQKIELLFRILPFAGIDWDVIYFPWISAAIVQMPLFSRGKPVVVSCRGKQVNIAPYIPRQEWLREGIPQIFQLAAAVHCVSEDMRQEALKLDLDPAKTYVIRPAVDPHFFVPPDVEVHRARKSENFRLINVASLTWRKGHEFALLAIRHLVDRGVPAHLTIIGNGPDMQHLLFTIQDLDLEKYVRLAGHASPDVILNSLQDSDAFLLSSVSEGISNAVLEAMACGLPVVSTDCGGMREAVTSGTEGFLVPVRRPEAMADALQKIWEDPVLREKMSRAARQRILNDFSLKNQIQQFCLMFKQASQG
jgi:colanic acid/amylovoran biosynthesis glycosyltransferase